MTARILDAAIISTLLPDPPADPRAYLLTFYPQAEIPPLDHVNADARPMIGRVNHGQWIASCECGAPGVPAPGMLLWLPIPLGWCVRCSNAVAGGGWRRVSLPPEPDRSRIEAVLLCRPHDEDRNWSPAETVYELVRQNINHGDPLPEDW